MSKPVLFAIVGIVLSLTMGIPTRRSSPSESRPVPVVTPPVSTEVEDSGNVLNPYANNPLHGRHVKSVYKILECGDLFHRRPHGLPNVSMGYGKYFLRIDKTEKVGADPDVIGFMEIYRALRVKPCSEQRDETDCVCDKVARVCYAEPEMIQFKGIKKGMQHPAFADPYSLVPEDALFADFKSLCTRG